MTPEYKFYLDNHLIDSPKGWEESKRKIKRSDIYKGIFLEYVNDLTFHGDGYDYIKTALEATGFCTKIAIQILYRCSEFDNYTVYFRGLVNLQDAEFDEERCEVKTNIEDDTLTGIITRLADTKVPFDSTFTVTGTPLSSIRKTIRLHAVGTGVYGPTTQAYFVSDAFQYILDFISDKSIVFVSDFFQTRTVTRATTFLTFTNPTVDLVNTHPIPNVVIKYKNAFGQTKTATAVKQATVAATLSYIISQLNYNTTGAAIGQQFYDQDYQFINKATTNGTNIVTMVTDLPDYHKVSVTGAASSLSTNFTNPIIGFKYLSLTTGNQLRQDNTKVPIISFKEIFSEMNKLFDLGMSLSTTSGVTTLRIEPIEYFFSSNFTNLNLAVNLENVIDIKFKQSKEFENDTIKTGDGNDNQGIIGNQTTKSDWLSSSLCSGEKLNLEGEWIVDSEEYDDQIAYTTLDKDDKIFVTECVAGGPNDADSAKYQNIIYNTTGAANNSYYAYNSYLTNYWRIINSLFNIKGNPKFKDKVITNTKSVKFDRLYEFKYPLTYGEHNTIIFNKEQFIKFNKETNSLYARLGWVKEIDFDNKTGLCTFKLLTR